MPESAQGRRALSEAIADIMVERQRLCDVGAAAASFDANWLGLARLKHQLSVAVKPLHPYRRSRRGA